MNRRHLARSSPGWTFQYRVTQRNVKRSRLGEAQLPLLNDLAPGFRGVEEVLQVVIRHDDAVRFFGEVEQKPEQRRGGYISVLLAKLPPPRDGVLETSSRFGRCRPQRGDPSRYRASSMTKREFCSFYRQHVQHVLVKFS